MLMTQTALAQQSTNSVTANGVTSYILEDTDSIRLVETPHANSKVTAKYDKIENTLTVTVYENAKIVSTKKLDINKAKQDNKIDKTISSSLVMARSSVRENENTWTNFEFTRFSDNKWEIRRPDSDNPVFDRLYFTIQQNDENYDKLREYSSLVYAINGKEGELIGYCSLEILTTGIGAFLAGFTGGSGGIIASTAFAALGLTGLAVVKAMELGELCDNALTVYWDLFDMK